MQQMISRCFGVDDLGQFGLNWLKNNFLGDVLQERSIYINFDRKSLKTHPHNKFNQNLSNNYISEEELDKYRYIHPYMKIRKLSNDIIEKFDVRL